MEVFRIARTEHANLDGIGSMLFPGRWHEKGVRCVYAASSRALSMLEYLVHISFPTLLPDELSIMTISVPDDIRKEIIDIADMPEDWKTNLLFSRSTGSKYLKSAIAALIQVPSAIVPEEFNYLINPLHADFQKIQIKEVKALQFDSRLIN